MIKDLGFKVSSGLKTVIGSDLITEDEVAIFELVKNSYDANSTKVDIFFYPEKIILMDNGIGMSYDDIINKWLFVAYSDKKNNERIQDNKSSISNIKSFAGSKGIGRFSADRLGHSLILQTRAIKDLSKDIHQVYIDWNNFDINSKATFENIKVRYSTQPNFDISPLKNTSMKHGTVLIIKNLKRIWNREMMLNLKSSLAKLINPFGESAEKFKIELHADTELENDNIEIDKASKKNEECPSSLIVNGLVGNSFFSLLKEKTTSLSVSIINNGKTIETIFTDRGELVYHIKEKNEYTLLSSSAISCQLYFLNKSAKLLFSKKVGTDLVKFGSVLLFKNDIRIFPVGNKDDDWWGINRRKQQGYNRFLGTRDVLGRVDIFSKENLFIESSSRNSGLLENEHTKQLKLFFINTCFKRLENYIVPVTFSLPDDKYFTDISNLLNDEGKKRVSNVLAKLISNKNIELIDYSKNLVSLVNEKNSNYELSLQNIRKVAEKTNNADLLKQLDNAELHFRKLIRERNQANISSLKEYQERLKTEKKLKISEEKVKIVQDQIEEEKKRNLFLTSLSTLDKDVIINLHHQILMYTVNIEQSIELSFSNNRKNKNLLNSSTTALLEKLMLLNKKIMNISKFATKANFRLESDYISEDIINYIKQYINEIVSESFGSRISINVITNNLSFHLKFKPIEVSIIIDNLVTNAIKAKSSILNISFTITNNILDINVSDNGIGFSNKITNLNRIFEKGFSLTNGSGLGLYYIQNIIKDLNGTIEALTNSNSKGASFLIRIKK
jgi:signal transduction histidine kinase